MYYVHLLIEKYSRHQCKPSLCKNAIVTHSTPCSVWLHRLYDAVERRVTSDPWLDSNTGIGFLTIDDVLYSHARVIETAAVESK